MQYNQVASITWYHEPPLDCATEQAHFTKCRFLADAAAARILNCSRERSWHPKPSFFIFIATNSYVAPILLTKSSSRSHKSTHGQLALPRLAHPCQPAAEVASPARSSTCSKIWAPARTIQYREGKHEVDTHGEERKKLSEKGQVRLAREGHSAVRGRGDKDWCGGEARWREPIQKSTQRAWFRGTRIMLTFCSKVKHSSEMKRYDVPSWLQGKTFCS